MPPASTPSSARRIWIENVSPAVACGRFPAKRTLGERVWVSADIFRDGHEQLEASVRYLPPGQRVWASAPLAAVGNDRFEGSFELDRCGRWQYTIEAWSDRAATWREELRRKLAAGQSDLSGELAEGAAAFGLPAALDLETALASELSDRRDRERLERPLQLDCDPVYARFGAWYELFPRSFGGFAGVGRLLPQLATLGFDVVYLTPIHPIGTTGRKGANNTRPARPGDPGSPWAIGDAAGGHTSVHPELGTLDDFDRLVGDAAELGLRIALDLAFQCSPDHPWISEHPAWFRHRPDGTIAYAENPPKRYEDIVNFDFDTEERDELWQALLGIVLFWVSHAVSVFRVDNPHTKPLAFWEWLIGTVRRAHPEVVFLAEAFTTPAKMRALAKVGFNQSYTYFTWKNSRFELTEYLQELGGAMAEYARPNFFVNTPDILSAYLQVGGQPAFEARLVLAATLSPSYGVYSGYERCESTALHSGSEEYLDSEKFARRARQLEGPLLPLIGRLNEIRRSNRSLQQLAGTSFLETANDQLIAYVRRSATDTLIVCVNLDPFAAQEGLAVLPADFPLPDTFTVQDLLSARSYRWQRAGNYLRLEPGQAHIMQVG